jgi:hypothetical protein
MIFPKSGFLLRMSAVLVIFSLSLGLVLAATSQPSSLVYAAHNNRMIEFGHTQRDCIYTNPIGTRALSEDDVWSLKLMSKEALQECKRTTKKIATFSIRLGIIELYQCEAKNQVILTKLTSHSIDERFPSWSIENSCEYSAYSPAL